MYDIHAHLNFSNLLPDVSKVVKESKKTGLAGIIVASSNLADSKIAIDLARKYPGFLYASAGIHPQKTDPENKASVDRQLSELDKLISEGREVVVAVGETGLDFSLAPEGEEDRKRKEQEELFSGQIKLAEKYHLPLIIHARKAIDEVIKILGSKSAKGVFHCYSGGLKRIEKVINLSGNWYFGVDGNLTYDSGLQNVVAKIPKDRLLIETDSPFLAPVPHRGEICTPAYLPLTAEKVAEIWKMDIKAAVKTLTENTKKLFSFKYPLA